MAQTAARRAPRPSLLRRVGRVLYGILVALSAIVVGLFVALKVMARAPDILQPDPVIVPTVVVTDDPGTAEDETVVSETSMALRRRAGVHTFLLLGEDNAYGNADTIIVVSYDVPNEKIGMVSVPRDTLVNVSRKLKKINAAFGEGGAEQVRQEVSALLGIPIDHTIKVNLRAFRSIVDAVGGIDFYVPVRMDYDDPTQDLHIHFDQGMQHLNGKQALEVVRFRAGYGNADIGRIETQQKFLTAMAKKILSWQSISKISEFIDIFEDNVATDLSAGNLLYFATEALDVSLSTAVTTRTLPGDGLVTYLGIPYYYELFPEETLEIINECLNPYTTPVTMDMTKIFQVP